MRNDILQEILEKRKGEEYDVAVMYSGGKDSSYLLYLLKKVYNLRVIAVMVDNGFENDHAWDKIKRFTDNLEIPLEILKPSAEQFSKLFQILITENEYFCKEGVNHICFICNNLLWCNVLKFAEEKNIPYIASGLSLAQLNSGRAYPLEQNAIANSIAEKSTRVILKNTLEAMRKTKGYENHSEFRMFIEQFSNLSNKVKTIYPYIYHSMSVQELKDTLQSYGWEPPKAVDINTYISSGCTIMKKVVGELEKLGLITLNEREQAKAMVADGLLDEEQLAYANYDAKKDKVNLTDPIMDELGIKEYLLNKCLEDGHPVSY